MTFINENLKYLFSKASALKLNVDLTLWKWLVKLEDHS